MDIGLHYTHDDANSKLDPEVIAISENIELDSPIRGAVWDLFSTRAEPFETDEFEVYSRNYTPPEAEIPTGTDGTLWDSTGATADLPISSSTIDRLVVGHVLLVEDEIVVVKAVNYSADTIDVYERGAGDTSAAAHAHDSTHAAKIVGNAHVEGKVDPEAQAETTKIVKNYVQLIEESVDLTYADQTQGRKIGQTEQVLKQEAMERVMRQLANSAIYGTAQAPTKTTPGLTRGLISYLTDLNGANATSVGGAFNETAFQNALDDIRKKGGSANVAVMSVDNKRTFNTFDGADQVQTDRSDREGGKVLDAYIHDAGRIEPVVDLDMPNDKVALVDTRQLGKGWKEGDSLRYEVEPTNSRQRKETLQGKYGFAIEQVGVSHHMLTNLS